MTTEAIVGVQFSHEAPPAKPHPGYEKSHRSRRPNRGGSGGNIQAGYGYDSADTNHLNRRHWAYTDGNSADATATPAARKIIRERARYEVLKNNPIGLGIVLTLANDCIGTGPRLLMGLKNEKHNQRIQKHWTEWSQAITLADKLHVAKMSKTVDGEVVSRITVNPHLDTQVSLDWQLLECDRLEAPWGSDDLQDNYVDGVHLDRFGYPVAYDILRHHPGNHTYYSGQVNYDTFDARNIIHWFRADRPEQHRGVSEVQTGLNLFALMRRFTLATVSAAETAANISLVMTTDSPISNEEYDVEAESLMHDFWLDAVSLERNAATVLPNGWDIRQIAAQQPSTTYSMFKHELIAEISRCLTMPYNIAAANSADHNYASGRLDHQTYHHALKVERDRIGRLILNRLFSEWMHEAALVPGLLPKTVSRQVLDTVHKHGVSQIAREFRHTWNWDGFSHSDPVKEAQADALKLKSGITHRAAIYSASGLDIDTEDTIAAENSNMSVDEYRKMLTVATYFNGNAFGMMEGEELASTSLDRDATTETSTTGGAGSSRAGGGGQEPPQLRQANLIKRMKDDIAKRKAREDEI